jgi:hypothetical protein
MVNRSTRCAIWAAALLASYLVNVSAAQLIITGVFDGPLPGGLPKGIELFATEDIADLASYGVGSANNGGGSAGVEFTFPGDPATAGQFLYLATEQSEFENFFNFLPDYTTSAMLINGDDAIELFRDGQVMDTFGQIDVDGTGQPWEYIDGWAYREDQTGPDGSTFELAHWFFSGPDALDGATSNDDAIRPVPVGTYVGGGPGIALQAGDADQDLDFDQLDLVKVQIASKYLTGRAATWGDGDWNAAPGGTQGSPPPGDGFFNQRDIIAAQLANIYLTGPYGALAGKGTRADAQTSIVYDSQSGELAVDAPAGSELTSINIDSAAGIFTGSAAQNLGGSFDNDADNNIFKATFGSSFGSLSFGNVAQAGLSEQFLLGDLSVVGSLAGGGALGNVDLIYVLVPEPSGIALLGAGLLVPISLAVRRHSKTGMTVV